MSDVKLFKYGSFGISEVTSAALQVEKSLQSLFEAHLETLLGIKFIASEHATGPVHGGRIDTLGLDEDGCPVIIEYKRAVNENVINQGLFYLDWLMDHRKDFQWLVLETLGKQAAADVDWSSPRLLCIAGDFTRYDEHAVKQINRNIELLRYKRFGDELLMLELVHAPRVSRSAGSSVSSADNQSSAPTKKGDPYQSQRISYRLGNASSELQDLFGSVSSYLSSLGDDVQVKELKNYIAFKRIRNFACLEIYPQVGVITVYLKLNPDSVALEERFARDVRNIGHFGTGDLEISIRTEDDFLRAQDLFQRAYNQS